MSLDKESYHSGYQAGRRVSVAKEVGLIRLQRKKYRLLCKQAIFDLMEHGKGLDYITKFEEIG